MYRHFFKRLFDIVLSFLGIIVFALPMVIIAIAVRCDSKGPIFFKQARVGKKKKIFKMLKFRTMRTDTPSDAPTHELSDPTKWITKVGGFLRKTSLDELPQMFNIFVGQMSIIGPRPAIWNQNDLIDERDKYGANDIKPGLTGWAQVNGRDLLASNTEKKAQFDGEYAKKITFAKDLRIFFMTIGQVFRGEDIVEGDAVLKENEAETKAQENTEESAVMPTSETENTEEKETLQDSDTPTQDEE